MKAQAEIEVIFAIGMAIMVFVIIFQIPKIFFELVNLWALASSEGVARDLAGLITISMAAPREIVLIYDSPSKDVSYDVEIDNSVVIVKSPFKELPGKGKIGISLGKKWSFEGVKRFEIVKKTKEGRGIEIVAS